MYSYWFYFQSRSLNLWSVADTNTKYIITVYDPSIYYLIGISIHQYKFSYSPFELVLWRFGVYFFFLVAFTWWLSECCHLYTSHFFQWTSAVSTRASMWMSYFCAFFPFFSLFLFLSSLHQPFSDIFSFTTEHLSALQRIEWCTGSCEEKLQF